jgi:hypothetical protein
MASPAARSDLPQKVASRLADLSQRVRMQNIAKELRASLLTDEEINRLPETPEGLAQMPETFAVVRGLSLERSTIELAMEAGFLEYGEYRSLRREIGEQVDGAELRPVPNWDPKSGELVFNGMTVRRVSSRAENMRRILGAFQESGWPHFVDNPLPGGADSQKLREAVRNLNKGLSALRFLADGSATGILWQDDN